MILERAAVEERVAVSADSDFAMLLALSRGSKPSFLLFREVGIVRARDYVSIILASIPLLETEIDACCVVTFRRGRVRVRSLPLGRR